MNAKAPTRDLFRSLCVAAVIMLALAIFARAEEKPAPAEPTAAATPPVDEKSSTTESAPPAKDEKSDLRQLDDAAAQKDSGGASMSVSDDSDDDNAGASKPADKRRGVHAPHLRLGRRGDSELVSIGHDSVLPTGEKSDEVVSVFGSSTADGDVAGDVVSVLGNTRVSGSVDGSAVAVLGSTYVNNHVHGDVVAVGGSVELGPKAEVDGEVVAVGGTVMRDAHAVTHGLVNKIHLAGAFSDTAWLKAWILECALKGRMLGFEPDLGWAWCIAVGALAFYALLALLFADGVKKCAVTLETRPGFSILTALLSLLLAPILMVLLAITGFGIVVVPFIVAALLVVSIFGKVVMLAWLGRATKLVGRDYPVLAVLVGGVIALLLYVVPILGIIAYKLFGWFGMGAVVYTLIQGMKRDRVPVIPVSVSGPVNPPPVIAAMAAVAPSVAEMPATAVPAGSPPVVPPPVMALPPVPHGVTLPRAGFWLRMAAMLLDLIIVGVIIGPVTHHGNFVLPCLAIYAAIMWQMKGTTIGGIICGLKVVRLDDRPIDWATAIVRALGCFLSLAVVFLGFIWVVIDDEKQSWHDKIAGTVVVKTPKGTPLV